MYHRLICLAIAIVIGTLRLHGQVSSTYQAIAHLYVGFLIGLGFAGRWWCWAIAVALSVVETFAVFRLK